MKEFGDEKENIEFRNEWYVEYEAVTQKIFSETGYIKPHLECVYTFPIDLVSNGIPIDAILIGKVYLESKFSLI